MQPSGQVSAVSQAGPWKPRLHLQVASFVQVPLPLQGFETQALEVSSRPVSSSAAPQEEPCGQEASPAEQSGPENPLKHEQLPLAWHLPWSMQFPLPGHLKSTSQAAPPKPLSQAQRPVLRHWPCPWHLKG